MAIRIIPPISKSIIDRGKLILFLKKKIKNQIMQYNNEVSLKTDAEMNQNSLNN